MKKVFITGAESDFCFRISDKHMIGINSKAICYHDIP